MPPKFLTFPEKIYHFGGGSRMNFCKRILEFNIAKAKEEGDMEKYRSSLVNLQSILNEERNIMEGFQ